MSGFHRLNVLQQERMKRAARRQRETVHDKAVGLVREIGTHDEQIVGISDDRTLHVDGVPKDQIMGGEQHWPCEKGACFAVAQMAVKAATERGCGKIIVHRSSFHTHEFDVVDVLARCKRRAGGVLRPPRLKNKSGQSPRHYGQAKHIANGSMFDVTRPVWRVPIALSGMAGGKGGRNG